MDLIVKKTEEISGNITPSPSKFYTQFTTAISLLTDGKNEIESPLLVDDTRGLVKAVESMGATTKRSKKKWRIWGNGKFPHPTGQVIDAKKSLTSLGLLASLSALASRIMVVTGKKQIRACSVASLIEILKKLGVDIHSTKSDETPPLVTFKSEIKGGEISLPDEYDRRFIPALLILAPYAEEGVSLELKPSVRSYPIGKAIEIMKKSGIEISNSDDKLEIEPGEYETVKVKPPLDLFSTMPFVTGAVLTNSEIEISKIGESIRVESFLSLLDDVGIAYEDTDDSIKIESSQGLKGKEISLEEYPEILPFVAVLANIAEGKTKIIDSKKARNMKSDRISAIAEGLNKMGASVKEKEDGMTIEGPTELEGEIVNGHQDDTIVAALGIAGLKAEGKTIVKNRAEILRESYPKFVSTFTDLGADMSYSS